MDASTLPKAAISFVAAFILVSALVPIIKRLCVRWRLFDPPGSLKIHTQPIPRLGGIAIVAGLAAGTLLAVRLSNPAIVFLWVALTLIWIAGLVDDIRQLSPRLRLLAQIGGASLLYSGGWRLWPSGPNIIALVADCFWVVLFVNAFNFLDGTDGLAAGVTGVIALAYIIFPGSAVSVVGYALAWSLLGACIGFLIFNFPPAKIFMGDSGSEVLGFSVAFLGLDFIATKGASNASPLLAFPLLVAALPLFDAILAILRRLESGRSPFHGDRRHFYDLLRAAGWAPKRVAVTCYLLTALLAGLGWLATTGNFKQTMIIGIGAAAALLWAALWLGSLRPRAPEPPSHRASV